MYSRRTTFSCYQWSHDLSPPPHHQVVILFNILYRASWIVKWIAYTTRAITSNCCTLYMWLMGIKFHWSLLICYIKNAALHYPLLFQIYLNQALYKTWHLDSYPSFIQVSMKMIYTVLRLNFFFAFAQVVYFMDRVYKHCLNHPPIKTLTLSVKLYTYHYPNLNLIT